MTPSRRPQGPRPGAGAALRRLLIGALAVALGCGCAVGIAVARSGATARVASPLRLSGATLRRSGARLRVTLTVSNASRVAIGPTEAALVVRPTRGGVLDGAASVVVPGLASGGRRRLALAGTIPDTAAPGRAQVLACVDVASQLARFDSRRDCRAVGREIRIPRRAGAGRTSPAPRTTLVARPGRVTPNRTASFRFSSNVRPRRFRCRLDDGPWLPCASPRTYPRLVIGDHAFAVEAISGAGRADPSPARASWRVTAPAPRRVTTPTVTTPTPTTPTAPAPAPPTTIGVDAADRGPAISAGDFGSDVLAPFDGMGSFDAAAGTFWPSFTAQLTSQVGAGSLRFPGGITAQSYDWTRAIGPQAHRGANPVGPAGRPSPSTVGPDEFGHLLDLTGAEGVVDVDFANGTAAEAADFVHYMTDTQGTWAQQRAADGHPAAYDVPYWEVGNEEQTPQFWRAGSIVSVGSVAGVNCPADPTGLYICGGTTRFAGQSVVGAGDGDRSPGSAISDGTAGQRFRVAYPPVSGTPTVSVAGVGGTWTEVGSLSGQPAGAQVFTLDAATGTITFGDGTHGAIPPAGARVTATYESGPHDGFAQFYAAMKNADPAISVCATDTGTAFIDDAGSAQPYDCLQDHPYVGAGDISPTLPIDAYESQVMTVPDIEAAAVTALQTEVDAAAGRYVPLVLSEYGQLISSTPDPLEAPDFLNSLDEALVNASQLADWITLGIPVADRQLLAAELPDPGAVTAGLPGAAPFATSGAITTPGPDTVVQPTGEYLALMRPLAGGLRLDATVTGDPSLDGTTGDLAVVSAATGAGVQLVVINRSPDADVPCTVAIAGAATGPTATLTTLDGPSPLSDNTAQAPDTVSTATANVSVVGGSATITFPAHSISLVTLPG
jgi:alpha-L-arabinofuranosidase